LPLSEGRFAAKCPLSPQKWRSPSSNRKKNFAEIQKTEGKPCRDLNQGEAISTLIEYQGRISIMYAVGRHSPFQGAQRAFRSNRLSHEIGRRTLPRGKRLLPFAQASEQHQMRWRPRLSGNPHKCSHFSLKAAHISRNLPVGEQAYRQLTELYRALRLYVNCFQPSMKLLSKQRDGKKVRCVYDPAKTPLQRLLQSGVLPAEMQQELLEVAHALDPIRLFRCAVSCSPFVPNPPPALLRVFSVDDCTAGALQASGNAPDPAAGLHTLHQEQERRKRVLGWRRTTRTPLRESGSRSCPGWLPTLNGAVATSSGSCSAAPPDAINHYKSARFSEACGKYEPTSWKRARSNGKWK